MRWVALSIVLAGAAPGCLLSTEDLDGDGFAGAEDCDDHDASINPVEADVPKDGIDQDCNGADTVDRVFGSEHECDLLSDQTVECEGDDSFGQADAPLGQFTEVVAGDYHSCALMLPPASDAVCWGENNYGQAPGLVDGPFVDIGAGPDFSWGRRENGITICWGRCGRVSATLGATSKPR